MLVPVLLVVISKLRQVTLQSSMTEDGKGSSLSL